jgi:hypothetical protein
MLNEMELVALAAGGSLRAESIPHGQQGRTPSRWRSARPRTEDIEGQRLRCMFDARLNDYPLLT